MVLIRFHELKASPEAATTTPPTIISVLCYGPLYRYSNIRTPICLAPIRQSTLPFQQSAPDDITISKPIEIRASGASTISERRSIARRPESLLQMKVREVLPPATWLLAAGLKSTERPVVVPTCALCILQLHASKPLLHPW